MFCENVYLCHFNLKSAVYDVLFSSVTSLKKKLIKVKCIKHFQRVGRQVRLSIKTGNMRGEASLDLSEGNKMCLPASGKVTNEHIISCLLASQSLC